LPISTVKRGEDTLVKAVQLLLQALIADLTSEKPVKDAGWRSIPELDPTSASSIVYSGMVLQRGRELRLNIESPRTQDWVRRKSQILRKQLEYAQFTSQAVQEDGGRVRRALQILADIQAALAENPTLWAEVLVIGWWRMLESSGMPAPTDDVLAAKFSPSDWIRIATQASGNLAMRVASSAVRAVSLQDGLDYLSRIISWREEPFQLPPIVDDDSLERVMHVLRWEEIEAQVPSSVQRSLGFAWFCHTAWSLASLVPVTPEYSVKLSDGLHNTLNQVAGFSENAIDEVVDSLAHRGISWGSDLLTLPELV